MRTNIEEFKKDREEEKDMKRITKPSNMNILMSLAELLTGQQTK